MSDRFTQQDPIGLAGGMNLYGFAGGDPVNFSDPFGLCPACIIWLVRATPYIVAGVKLAVEAIDPNPNDAGSALVQTSKNAIKAARSSAVRQAWRQERDLVRSTGEGSRLWSDAEKAELLSSGRVRGYEGHHINSVNGTPTQAGNPNNIEFVRRDEHLRRHEGNWQNPTTGEQINRSVPPPSP